MVDEVGENQGPLVGSGESWAVWEKCCPLLGKDKLFKLLRTDIYSVHYLGKIKGKM